MFERFVEGSLRPGPGLEFFLSHLPLKLQRLDALLIGAHDGRAARLDDAIKQLPDLLFQPGRVGLEGPLDVSGL
ncbi:MAG: hypothetical protein ROR55_02885 [Devosia sp.]